MACLKELCLTVNKSAFVQLMRDNLSLPTCEQEINTPLPLPWRCFVRLNTVSLYFPTAFPSLFCLSTLFPHCFLLSDLTKAPGTQTLTSWLF